MHRLFSLQTLVNEDETKKNKSLKAKSTARRFGSPYAQPKFAHYLHAHQCPHILILVLNLKSDMINCIGEQCCLRHLVLVKSMKRLKRRRQERKEKVETEKNNSNIIKMQIQIGKRNKGNGKISYLLCPRRLHVLLAVGVRWMNGRYNGIVFHLSSIRLNEDHRMNADHKNGQRSTSTASGEKKERQNTLKRLQISCVTELQLLYEFVAFDHRNHSTMAHTHISVQYALSVLGAGCVCASSPFALHSETNERRECWKYLVDVSRVWLELQITI